MQLYFFDKPRTEKFDLNMDSKIDGFSIDDAKSPLHKLSIDDNKKVNNNHIGIIETSFSQRPKLLKQKTKMLCCMLGLIVILLAMLIIFLTLYINVHRDKTNKNDNDTCVTRECVQISSWMIEAMDFKQDPCDDFYQYACGNWVSKTPIPDSRTRYSRFERLNEQNSEVIKNILTKLMTGEQNASTPILKSAAIYYKSCMNTKEVERIGDKPMKNYITNLGSWPVTDPDWNESNWNAMESLVAVHKNISQAPIFNVYIASDIKNSTLNVLVFDQSGISMSKDTYLLNETYHIKQRTAYRTMMKAIAKQMGANESGIDLMDQVYEFEKALANITMSVMERRDYRLIYNTLTLGEFSNQSEIPTEWLSKFVNLIFKETGETVPLTERIVSFNVDYIKKAYKLFFALDPKVQASYVMWQAVRTMAPVVLGKYQDIMDDYYMTAYGTKDRQPRWEVCISSTSSAFGYALSRPFVEEVYDKTAKAMSTEMIQAIKQVFEANLDNMDWMDETTKRYARLKASKILENIGYPEFILNNTALEEEYRGLVIMDGEHFNNYMSSRQYVNLKNYEKRGKPVDKSEWGIMPTTVNAYYAPTENKIGFPAGILQWPFYDKRAPRAINYGAIGMVVGHEITHGFDDQGKDFTVEGNFDTWWTNHSSLQFQKKSQCFIDQYSKFELFGRKMRGQQTLGEDLADNGGIRQALQAYRIWVAKNGQEQKLPGLDLTPDQLYFLAFAQVWCTAYRESAAINQIENGLHSLSIYRVMGTLQNSADFSAAYNCPVGAKMNPPNKCQIW